MNRGRAPLQLKSCDCIPLVNNHFHKVRMFCLPGMHFTLSSTGGGEDGRESLREGSVDPMNYFSSSLFSNSPPPLSFPFGCYNFYSCPTQLTHGSSCRAGMADPSAGKAAGRAGAAEVFDPSPPRNVHARPEVTPAQALPGMQAESSPSPLSTLSPTNLPHQVEKDDSLPTTPEGLVPTTKSHRPAPLVMGSETNVHEPQDTADGEDAPVTPTGSIYRRTSEELCRRRAFHSPAGLRWVITR